MKKNTQRTKPVAHQRFNVNTGRTGSKVTAKQDWIASSSD